MRAVTFFDGEAWRERVVAVVDGAVRVIRDASPDGLPRLDGVVTGGFTDSHVHLQLVDAAALVDSTLGAVVDLGGEPGAVRTLSRSLSEDARSAPESKRAPHRSSPEHAPHRSSPERPPHRPSSEHPPHRSSSKDAHSAPESKRAPHRPSSEHPPHRPLSEDARSAPESKRAPHRSLSEDARSGPESKRAPHRSLSEDAHSAPESKRLRVTYAGAFLTPPGGYPSDRAWAPGGSVREIADADAAARAVAEMKAAGATVLKVASNSTAGPVFSDEMLTTIVEIAASHNLSVIAHAEGPGEAMRAARAGVRMLAHAPFSERLSDAELQRMRDAGIGWVSTLGIHDDEAYAIALDNVRRFHAIGGDVVYGTDLGNGAMPLGLNPREIAALREAGFTGTGLIRALIPGPRTGRLLFHPGAAPESADPLAARPLTPDDLEESS